MATNTELNKDLGFVSKPFAIKKVIQTPEGGTQVVFVDSKTGKQVNPKGYTIIQSDNVVDNTNLSAQSQRNISQDGSSITTPTSMTQDATNTQIVMGNKSADTNVSKAVQAGDNKQGYVNKPGIMGFAGMLPGPLGLLGMGANLGVNASNQQKIADQRETLGFADQPGKRAFGTVFDTQGYVGEVKTTLPGGQVTTTPVSFEATDKYNRTAFTPDEARKRMAANPQMEEATPEETKAQIGSFNNQYPSQQSYASKMIEASKGFLGNIFGGSQTTPAGGGTGAGFNSPTGGSGGYGSGSFPTAPSKPNNTTTGVDTGRGPTGADTSGYGPGLW